MTPLDILPLADAKAYLYVDFEDDDVLITSLIKAAVDVFERKTEYRLYERQEVFETGGYETEIFAYPRRTYSITPTVNFRAYDNGVRLKLSFPNNYCAWSSSAAVYNISINVGYTSADQVPSGIIEWLKKHVTWYYENRNTNEFPIALEQELNQYKRMPLW